MNILKNKIEKAREKIEIGGIYYHYKDPNKKYIVLQIALLENSQNVAIVYQAEYGDKIIWIREIDNFLQVVEINGKKQQRFTLVNI